MPYLRAIHPYGLLQSSSYKAGIIVRHQPNSEMAIGRGVRAVIENKTIFVGSAHYMTDIGIHIAASTFLDQIDPGATLLYVAEQNELIGVIALKDTLRPEANAALHQIRAEGVTELGLMTGDTETTAGGKSPGVWGFLMFGPI